MLKILQTFSQALVTQNTLNSVDTHKQDINYDFQRQIIPVVYSK